MEPHYIDETYRAHDGVRDAFRWARFAEPRFLAAGLLLALVVILISSQDPSGTTAGDGVAAGSHVAATSVRMATGTDR